MSKSTVPDLKELFKQASEIAQQVPESMQEAAFNRAIDLLTGGTKQEPVNQRLAPMGKVNTNTNQTKSDEDIGALNDLLSAIDSTQHPGITSVSKTLDRSLMVLQIALNDHGVDGLTPTEIATILTEKFRVSTTNAAVSMALGKATSLVNRVASGLGYRYRIMGPGEEHLAHLGQNLSAPSAPKKGISKKKKTISNGSANKKAVSSKRNGTGVEGKRTQSKGGTGPKAAVISLIDSGFFSQGRAGPEVQTYLKSKRGFNFGTAQLSLAMLRLVREGKLDRDENAEGQYEYKKSKS